MTITGLSNSRTTQLLQTNQLLTALRRTQKQMQDAQTQMTTGQAINRPSDAPATAATILLLRASLAAQDQYQKNISFGKAILDTTESSLGDVSDLLLESKSVGMSQVGIGSNSDTRANQATVIDAHIQSLMEIANRQSQGVSLFGGSVSGYNGLGGQPVFVEELGGVRYVGARTNLAGEMGMIGPMDFNSNGVDAFNALSARVTGTPDLNPQAIATTRLADLRGAQGLGVRTGVVQLTVGSQNINVDLTSADTLDDVRLRIQTAINSIDPTAGSISVTDNGFTLTAAAGKTLALADIGATQTAGDLGIRIGPITGTSQVGLDVDPRLTQHTTLDSFPAPFDRNGSLVITQGAQTRTINLSSAQTVQDMMNLVDQAKLGVRLEINAQGSGFNLVSEISGPELTVRDSAGLGVGTFSTTTKLADLNNGLGVANAAGKDDFVITLHDNSQITVNIDGATTIGEVITKIKTAAEAVLGPGQVGNPGDVGTKFNIGLVSGTNGLKLEDQTTGVNGFRVEQLNSSLTATDLGIFTNAGTNSSIQGQDVGKVRVQSVFTHLMDLRDSLVKDDSRGISLATSALETDIERLARVRADVGVRSQQVSLQEKRSEEMKITQKSLLSNLQDADLTEVITRFSLLQIQMNASMQVGAQNLQTSFLDYLR